MLMLDGFYLWLTGLLSDCHNKTVSQSRAYPQNSTQSAAQQTLSISLSGTRSPVSVQIWAGQDDRWLDGRSVSTEILGSSEYRLQDPGRAGPSDLFLSDMFVAGSSWTWPEARNLETPKPTTIKAETLKLQSFERPNTCWRHKEWDAKADTTE